MPIYKRFLLKLSGEVLSGEKGYGIEGEVVQGVCNEIAEVLSLGCEIVVVVGGGNILRGITLEKYGVKRQRADYMGMVATYINALHIEDTLEKKGIKCKIYGALNFEGIAEKWDIKKVLEDLNEGRVVIAAGGTGNPFFSTDTAAILRASEIDAEVVLKGTKVDGVFDKDPIIHKDATFYSRITYMDALKMQLRVMDLTALTLAMERKIPLIVFNVRVSGNLKKAIMKEPVGTIIQEREGS